MNFPVAGLRKCPNTCLRHVCVGYSLAVPGYIRVRSSGTTRGVLGGMEL